MRTTFTATMLVAVLVPTVAPVAAQGARCDRACLEGIANQYLQALVAKDPKRVPLAANLRYTENGQRLLPGEGLWQTVSAEGTYKLHVADQTAGQIVTFVTMRENGVPFVMANRLRINGNRQITEVEAVLAHSEPAVKGFESRGKPREAFFRATPVADRVSRDELVRVANMYFSGMQRNDGKGPYPFADDCHRIENGNDSTNSAGRGGQPRPDPKTATGYSGMWTCREQFESGLLHFVSKIRDRRYIVVDEERGLVVGNVFFDHEASAASRNYKTPDGRQITNSGPARTWTWMISELFKVEKGLLHEIEAILVEVPYGMNSGWSSWEDGRSDRIQFPLK
jgi:hypothetical protein